MLTHACTPKENIFAVGKGRGLEKSNCFLITLLFHEILVSFTRFSEMLSHMASCLLFCLVFFPLNVFPFLPSHPAFFKWHKLCQFSCTRSVLWTQFFCNAYEISFMAVYMVMPIKPCTLGCLSFFYSLCEYTEKHQPCSEKCTIN